MSEAVATRTSGVAMPPVGMALPGDFVGPELARTPQRFIHELDEATRRELSKLLVAVSRESEHPEIERAVHDVMADATARTLRALTGRTSSA